MRESDIRDYLIRCVTREGGEIRKVRWIGRNGAPDELVLLPGRFCFVELKAPGEEPEAHQLREHKKLEKSGIPIRVIDSFLTVERLVYQKN